jgi:leucine dehydrogenase
VNRPRSSTAALPLAEALGHEEIVILQDPASGLRAVIAIHDTTLGPAVGGTRMRRYPSLDAAAVDALRLARAMTYKALLAEMPRGGGKAVILGEPGQDKSRALLVAYAKAVDRFGGRFQTGCDMGIDPRDIAVMSRITRHVSHTAPDAKLDTAGLAALGVLESIRVAAQSCGRDVTGLHVAVQGLGQVGYRLARLLKESGARLTVSDVDPGRAERAQAELGAAVVAPEVIYDVETDVFSPNAAGGILDQATVPRLRCGAVVGAANEQLAEAEDGDALHARGILYAPDYVVNAGGLLSLLYELGETDAEGVAERVRGIGGRLQGLIARARDEGLPLHRLTDRVAEERLAEARAGRQRS